MKNPLDINIKYMVLMIYFIKVKITLTILKYSDTYPISAIRYQYIPKKI